MRQLKSLGSAIAALLVSGIYGFAVAVVLDFALVYCFVTGIRFFSLNRTGGCGYLGDDYVSLMLLLLPLAGIIWGWTMALMRDLREVFFGIFLSVALPAAMLLSQPMEYVLSPCESLYEVTLGVKILVFVSGMNLLFILAYLWLKPCQRFFPQKVLQAFVGNSSLGRSSRGVRLLTVAILAQVLVLWARWHFYEGLFR